MTEVLSVWLLYLVSATTIAVAGYHLSRYGHVIADKTGLGGSVVGLVLLATVTSLPELVTGVASVTIADVPDIAVGDALGSCVFNLLILMFLELLHPQASIYTRVTQGHILSAGFGVMMIGFATLGMVVGDVGALTPVGHVGIETPVLVGLYLLGMQTITRYERGVAMVTAPVDGASAHPGVTLARATIGYGVAATCIAVAGTAMPFIAARLATIMHWNDSFVGTSFVALSTSLPEAAVVTVAARLGALDMAIANLLGSNLFDVLILAIDDIAYTRGPLLSSVSKVHAATALSAIIMTGAVVSALFYRPARRPLRWVGWTGLFLLSVYVMNAYLIYVFGA